MVRRELSEHTIPCELFEEMQAKEDTTVFGSSLCCSYIPQVRSDSYQMMWVGEGAISAEVSCTM